MTIHFQRRHEGTLSEAYQVFFDALKKDSIDGLIQAAWDFFGLPILLTDENYKSVCQYPKRKLGQPIWDALLENTALPLEVIQSYNQAYLNNSEPYYQPFYSDVGPAVDCPRIFGEIHSQNRIYGYVGIFYFDSPLLPQDLEATQILLDALKMLLLPRHSREGASLSSYLRDLLEEDTAPEAKALALRSLAASLPGSYAVMATPIGTTASQQSFAFLAISQIPLRYRSAVSAIYRGCIVTLFGRLGKDPHSLPERTVFQQAAQFLSPTHESSGVSPLFSDLTQLSGRFQQAHMASLAIRQTCVFFQEVFPAPIFEAVSIHANVDMFLHPALHQLLAYDAANQTEYFRTLQVYSLTLHNKESSARILCIHRNTLLYRLGKISELFHIPFEDQHTALALLNSFQLYGVHTLGRGDFGLANPSDKQT
ncbi:MAG: PucR family transcriptional regulator [Acutalibacter sp.]|jgi:hypothetical protein